MMMITGGILTSLVVRIHLSVLFKNDTLIAIVSWCGPSANLECMAEMCCTRLAGNTGRKNDPKNRHLRTTAQLCRAIS